jgi:hypothetical protein
MRGLIRWSLFKWVGAVAIAVLFVSGCRSQPPETPDRHQPLAPADVLPGADVFPGWKPAEDVETYNRESLFDLVNGQADAFFVYGFEQVAVQSYENAEGAALRVEVWQLASPADAYGLFTTIIGGTPVTIGNEGDAEPGRRLTFWQDRYLVQVHARQPLDDADLQGFARAISAALPSGGERPALMDRLPPDGLVERSPIFFREEISIQSYLWLGGENLLGLSPETDGVLARYAIGGERVQLLLVQYPDETSASAGLEALRAGQVSGLVTALTSEDLLGAVFGTVGEAEASELVATALSRE